MRACAGRALALLSAFLVFGAARPYEDTRRRFRIDLEDGWELAPHFGDTSGMVFRRVGGTRQQKSLVILLVHVDSIPARDSKEYADRIEDELARTPGFERLGERSGMIGEIPALIREYRMLASAKPRIEKMVRVHFLEAFGHRYLLHVESTVRDFRRAEREVLRMLASFRPLAGGAPAPVGQDGSDSPPRSSLSGRWVNADGLALILGDDKTFALAETSGLYEIEGATLTLILPGQGRESFTFTHDDAKGTLVLSSPNLGTPMTYRRAPAAGRGTESPSADSRSNKAAPEVVGRWSTPTPSGPLVLVLGSEGRFTMGDTSGRWSIEGDRLVLTRGTSEAASYRFRANAGKLILEGGDLEGEVVFAREP